MILIADSGSTKTDWIVVSPEPSSPDSCRAAHDHAPFTTQGLNPFHLSSEQISCVLRDEVASQVDASQVDSVYFYGSGVTREMEGLMERLISAVFTSAETVEAHSDMLGAARALCGRNYGIASILGTGANSSLYDGERLVANTPALGYILGDEGSGAVLGKHFLHDLYKGILSEEIKADFERSTGLTMATVVNKVYREPQPNRFLASLSEYIHSRLQKFPELRTVVIANFVDFFSCNIRPYARPDLPVSFVGSIAYYYEAELREAARASGFTVGTILRSPLEGLVDYHS